MATFRLLILPLLAAHVVLAQGVPSGQASPPTAPQRQAKAPAIETRSAPSVPSWADDARWYHVVVPRFHNANVAQGPADGTLAGLVDRLGYLKELGINTLLLDALFHDRSAGKRSAIDLRHIDDRLGEVGSLALVSGETADPGTWRFSKTDQLFRSFVKTAHDQGFRVAVAVDVDQVVSGLPAPGDLADHWLAVTRRWMDPNADGNPSDGIDGWVVAGVEGAPRGLWRTWRTQAKKLNPNALLVVDVKKNTQAWLGSGGFDVAVNHETGAAIRRFFASAPTAYPIGQFVDDLVGASKRHAFGTRNASLTRIGGPGMDRLRTLLTKSPAGNKKTSAAATGAGGDALLARLRLATFLAQFSQGAPVTYYGDEVGLSLRDGEAEPALMWWPDLRGGATGSRAGYDAHLASVIRWLGVRRSVDEPLARGSFEKVMVDEARRLFAVGRSFGGRRAILLMNVSDTKQRVMLKVGTHPQRVTLLSPHVKQVGARRAGGSPTEPVAAHVAPLGMLVAGQDVNDAGEVRLWVDGMSVRVVLVGGAGSK